LGRFCNLKFDTSNTVKEKAEELAKSGIKGETVYDFCAKYSIGLRTIDKWAAENSIWRDAVDANRAGLKAFWANVIKQKALSGDTQAIIFAAKSLAKMYDKKTPKIQISQNFASLPPEQKLKLVEEALVLLEEKRE